jgi:hypothetical protein
MSVRQKDDFDFSLIRKRTGDFDESEDDAAAIAAADEAERVPQGSRSRQTGLDDQEEIR